MKPDWPAALICPKCGPGQDHPQPFQWAEDDWLCGRCFFIEQRKTIMVTRQHYQKSDGYTNEHDILDDFLTEHRRHRLTYDENCESEIAEYDEIKGYETTMEIVEAPGLVAPRPEAITDQPTVSGDLTMPE